MSKRFPILTSPIRVGRHVLKSRMIAPHALPHYLQGPEGYPSAAMIDYLSGLAANGAAIVGCNCWDDTDQRLAGGTAGHFPMYDYTNPASETYISKMVDAIHFEGALASIHLCPNEMPNFQPLSDPGIPFFDRFQLYKTVREVPVERLHWIAEETARKCRYFRSLGFDMVSLHMGYHEYKHIGINKFISPLSNDREDEYGGNVENRYRLCLEICRAVKEACGQDFLIDLWVAGREKTPGGITTEDTVAFSRLAEGTVDILHIRGGDIDEVHPTGYNSVPEEPSTLAVARAVKQRGGRVVVAAAGGYGDPVRNERFLAAGDLDMVAVGRQFICDDEYGRKIMEDRPEDIIPCQRCAKCHVPYPDGPWIFICSGNPKRGLEDRLPGMIKPPGRRKRVAVVGGGIAGIEAAVTAAERGHEVTLYEASDRLGGQLLHADHAAFKWPLRDFKDAMLRQLRNAPVRVILGVRADVELLSSEGYDAVVAALGSSPLSASIPCAPAADIWLPDAVFGNEAALGSRVVVIGGGEIGTETGLHLAECGHQVTIITRQDRLASGAVGTHYRDMLMARVDSCAGLSYITNATATEIRADCVCYHTEDAGTCHRIVCDTVVVSAGRRPLTDEALAFASCAEEFYIVGDCREVGSVQKSMRAAFSAGSRI